MEERFIAWKMAERLLDEADSKYVDPDDELRTLSRQLLRAKELIQVVQPMVKQFAWEHQVGSNQKIAQWVETYLHGDQESTTYPNASTSEASAPNN